MTDKYKHLKYFCSYFGPSWKTDFGNINRALRFFFKTSDAIEQAAVRDEISDFLEAFPGDEKLEDALLELGCFYSPSFAKLTDREWLLQVQKEINLKLGSTHTSPPKPINGISGNTGDDRHRRLNSRQTYFFRRIKDALIPILVFAFIWEAGYRYSRKIYGENNVSRLNPFIGVFRQHPNAKGQPSNPVRSQQMAPQATVPRKSNHKQNQVRVTTQQFSTVQFEKHNANSGPSFEEFMFKVGLDKRDGWFDTKIPVAAGNLVDCYTIGQNQIYSRTHIVLRIGDEIRELRSPRNTNDFLNLSLAAFDYEVEADHIILKADEMETLFLRLEDDDKDSVPLRLTLVILHGKGGLEETKQRELALINHVGQNVLSH